MCGKKAGDVKKITQEEASALFQTGMDNRSLVYSDEIYTPKGLFYQKDGDVYIGIDNSTGCAWTEEFRSLGECFRWLMGAQIKEIKKGTIPMAISYIENAIAVSYRGVKVYHIHKDDLAEQPVRQYLFTLNPYGCEASEDTFDIRDMKGYDSTLTQARNLVRMIESGLFGDFPVESGEKDTVEAAQARPGRCPVCGAEIEGYGAFEVYDEQIEYPFTCENCGVSGSEWGIISFDGFTVEHERPLSPVFTVSEVSKEREWLIPVTWEMCGIVRVQAEKLSDAMLLAGDEDGVIPLPSDGSYVDGSWRLSTDDEDTIMLYQEQQKGCEGHDCKDSEQPVSARSRNNADI